MIFTWHQLAQTVIFIHIQNKNKNDKDNKNRENVFDVVFFYLIYTEMMHFIPLLFYPNDTSEAANNTKKKSFSFDDDKHKMKKKNFAVAPFHKNKIICDRDLHIIQFANVDKK